ncbi:hypothetical protein CPC08DRAFT_729980 [Agrocybe pediades]|nr:hypothetical protein CPC08DRAFT_729980 [Agrocybe pediades]
MSNVKFRVDSRLRRPHTALAVPSSGQKQMGAAPRDALLAGLLAKNFCDGVGTRRNRSGVQNHGVCVWWLKSLDVGQSDNDVLGCLEVFWNAQHGVNDNRNDEGE